VAGERRSGVLVLQVVQSVQVAVPVEDLVVGGDLIEQPGQDLGTGMSRLARALSATPAPSLYDLCDTVLASLGPHPRDDVTLLLARTATQTARRSPQGLWHG
jgi:Stage II sporulation protein E (SpoIIE)